jgi:DNA-binding transcriptional regulator YiaG
MRKIVRKDIPNFLGFEYLVLKNAPTYETKYGEVIDLSPAQLEMIAAKIIIEHRIPLRGKEIKLLRSVLGLSLEKFAREFDLTSGCILKWEKAQEEYISRPNQIAVSLFVAEKLEINVSNKFSKLISTKVTENIDCVAS